jgi:uncharacterized membrane protein
MVLAKKRHKALLQILNLIIFPPLLKFAWQYISPQFFWFIPFFFVYFAAYFAIFVLHEIPTRNLHMMIRMENVLKEKRHEKALLVTGKKHVRDFRKRLSKKYDVEILGAV